MIGDDAQSNIMTIIYPVAGTRHFTGCIQNRQAGIDFVNVVDALQQSGHPLKTHSSIDVFRRQLPQNGVPLLSRAFAPLKLHEN